ncbi:hypothetical protein DdX_06368 [Ditylenchus destructor]|uniref:Uncharacterized protein n=1 Tax=Ditylenchus destructor TaxID=166010 RepID=A0AAD4N909_9BILA|nr:hypothetical protein DdX_06368 [Ditylenchus destructor]
MTPGSSERRSRFRTKRISLKPCQVCAYYGLCESDEEGEELRIAPITKQNRDSDQTTFVAPSFRCSLPVSDFQSPVSEDASFDNQTESLEKDIVKHTKAKQNRDSDQTTFVAPSFRCSLPVSDFQTTATQTENLEDDLTDRTKAKQNRDSDQTTFVAPSFRCSLPVSHFQSTVCEDASFDTQTESLENDIMERSKKYSVLSRTDGFSSPTQKENEEAQLPMNDDVIISDVESPPRQGNMARYSIIVPPPYRPGPVDTKAQPKPWRMEAKTLSICPRIPRRTNEHSAEQRNSFDKLQPTECAARNSIVSPVRTTKRQFERKIASPLDNETIANSKPKDSLREIQLNYITPTLAPRRRKSVFFSEYNTTYVYSDDKQGHFHISGTDSFEYAKSGKVDEIVNHSLAEDVENIRLGENSINNLSGSLGPMMMESLMDSTVLMDSDETNINESIVFGWQKKDGKTDKEEVPKIDCNQPGTSKQSQQFNILADSSMWDAGGVDDPSFYDNTVQFNDIEPSILDDSLPLTQQSRRCPEWPTIVDNSLGMSNSPASSNGHESYTVFGSQADSDNAFGAQMDSTILYGSQLESDDSLDSPKIKHIVIRASPKKKPLKYVLAAPKIQRNNPDSPTVVEDGLRRSKRNRIQTLDPGHLQKPIYERDAYGNETLVGVETCTVHNKLLTKHKTADPKTAFEMERQMQHRKKLEREKKKEVKELLSKNYSRYK